MWAHFSVKSQFPLAGTRGTGAGTSGDLPVHPLTARWHYSDERMNIDPPRSTPKQVKEKRPNDVSY